MHADLWEDRRNEPSKVVWDAVRSSIEETRAGVCRSLFRAGVRSVGIPGLGIDLERMGMPDGPSLPTALSTLATRLRGPVCLVIDEAQHARATESGRTMMFALKTARDAMNQGDGVLGERFRGRNLFLIFTGSNRGKLREMVSSRREPFFLGSLLELPLLPDGFAFAALARASSIAGRGLATEILAMLTLPDPDWDGVREEINRLSAPAHR